MIHDMFKWIPDFKVVVSKGHIILYVVVTAGLLWLAQYTYQLGYQDGHMDGWYDCCDWYQSHVVQPIDDNFQPYTPAPPVW